MNGTAAGRDAKRLARDLRLLGFLVERRRRHYAVFLDGKLVTTFAGSPSDYRWKANTIAKIRRYLRSRGYKLWKDV